MLEKIGTPKFKHISSPDPIVLEYIQKVRERNRDPIFYEIGIGVGATTQEVAKILDGRGRIVLFSFEKDVRELASDLTTLGYNNIDSSWGSPSNTYSGYHFQLAVGFVEQQLEPFDLAYVDGGHVFHLDAPAACILKELCKPGGYILFDDWKWTLAESTTLKPSNRPKTREEYDEQQIRMPHVQLVCKAIMDTDPRFKLLGVKSDTAIYQRV